MASMLATFKALPGRIDRKVEAKTGISLLEKAERALYAGVLGGIKGYYRVPYLELGVGAAAYAAYGLLGMRNEHLMRIGDAGLTTAVYTMAASWGADKKGYGVAIVQQPKAKQIPAGGNPQRTPSAQQPLVGIIPPRTGGAFLSPDDIANHSAPR